ncbi:hypothetical protein ROA7023_04199 [Roseisalinus antarcticus]|uniref:Uncharacterized protein n=1 Tax=Roseisalinus antarcticus TaxID=254357 RepID=A0A1Y5U166_9RHOB|nr:hypothetical protein ROA7023_04199 [Roseisalinus antarcticus]
MSCHSTSNARPLLAVTGRSTFVKRGRSDNSPCPSAILRWLPAVVRTEARATAGPELRATGPTETGFRDAELPRKTVRAGRKQIGTTASAPQVRLARLLRQFASGQEGVTLVRNGHRAATGDPTTEAMVFCYATATPRRQPRQPKAPIAASRSESDAGTGTGRAATISRVPMSTGAETQLAPSKGCPRCRRLPVFPSPTSLEAGRRLNRWPAGKVNGCRCRECCQYRP